MASRSMEKGNKAIAELRAETSRDLDVRFLRMDLLDLKSVVGAAEEFGRLEARLDLLINNAGVSIILFVCGSVVRVMKLDD